MSARRPKKSSSLAVKLTELAVAVPLVVAHRVTRLALAGSTPSPRDKKEFELMVAEKNDAFTQSWSAMAVQAARANQALALSVFTSLWLPGHRKPSATALASKVQRAALGVLSKGVTPVHNKAVANAKRLARTKLR